ncbi:hypothetical protein PS639_01146 [Pseudomonas fluorescens]|nr:hypothetical protein PS639_01146 [Pseudomonas fluorescens]
MALVDSDSFYVSGYFEETKLPRIEEGSQVRIQIDPQYEGKGRLRAGTTATVTVLENINNERESR